MSFVLKGNINIDLKQYKKSNSMFNFHKVTLLNVNTGNIPWPTKRGKNSIFNPSSPCCVVKCICAAVEHKNLLKNKKNKMV